MNKKGKRHPKSAATPVTQQLFRIAVQHQQAGRPDKAGEICEQLIKQNPQDLMALGLLGSISKQQGNIPRATKLFREALKVKPNFVPALGNLGDIYRLSGSYPEALRCYKKLVHIEPDNMMGHYNMGIVFLVLTQFDDAIAQFRKVLNIRPNLPAALSNIGCALMELGRADEAIAIFEQALAIAPGFADAHYNMHAAVFDDNNPAPGMASLKATLAAAPTKHEAHAYLGMYMDFSGDKTGAEEHFSFIKQYAPSVCDKVDSWRYVSSHLNPGVRLFSLSRNALEYSFSKARLDGLVLEFGVRNGISTNILARLTDQDIHGFDSFEGLPEEWEGMPVGALSTFKQLPKVPDHVHLHPGWFEDTLPGFVEAHPGPIRFMNVDCDIYSSTTTIFHHLIERIVPGTVIIFDEYICNPAWRDHEYKAFQEFIAKTGLKYQYLLFSPFSKQAAVLISS